MLAAVRRVLHVRPAKRRRFRPTQATLEQHGDNRPIGGAPVGCVRFRFHAAPGAPGDAGRCEDGGAIVGGERIGLAAAPARRLAGEALQNAADAIMAGWIIGAGVNVAGADRGADRAHGGRGGAIGNPLGKVGGDGERIGWQRLDAAIYLGAQLLKDPAATLARLNDLASEDDKALALLAKLERMDLLTEPLPFDFRPRPDPEAGDGGTHGA